MTFRQLEQFLKAEKWRIEKQRKSDACGKYARCAYCNHFCDYPCARAYDTLIKKKREGKALVTSWLIPEPDVKKRFGTQLASEEAYARPVHMAAPRRTESSYPQTAYRSLPAVINKKEEPVRVQAERALPQAASGGTRLFVIRKRTNI